MAHKGEWTGPFPVFLFLGRRLRLAHSSASLFCVVVVANPCNGLRGPAQLELCISNPSFLIRGEQHRASFCFRSQGKVNQCWKWTNADKLEQCRQAGVPKNALGASLLNSNSSPFN